MYMNYQFNWFYFLKAHDYEKNNNILNTENIIECPNIKISNEKNIETQNTDMPFASVGGMVEGL